MRSAIHDYIESRILPRYEVYTDGHGRDHVEAVIRESLRLAAAHGAQADMAYVIAAYHDIGIPMGRKDHHLTSAAALAADRELKRWFSPEQLIVMKEAVEDHRASANEAPRSLYGRVIADADHFVVPEEVVRRTIQYGLANYPGLIVEEHIARAREHMREKYVDGGYLRFYLGDALSLEGLAALRGLVDDEAAFESACRRWL